MVNFTKLAVLGFAGVISAGPIDQLTNSLTKRDTYSWKYAGNAHWPSVQTCFDALCRGGARSYLDRCHSITKCEKHKPGGCETWYCDRVRPTCYVNTALPVQDPNGDYAAGFNMTAFQIEHPNDNCGGPRAAHDTGSE